MKILFMGRKKYAAQMLRWTIEQGNEVVGVVTDSQFNNSPTMLAAKSMGIPVISMEEANGLMAESDDYADLAVSYLFWRKIKEPLISKPKHGCINFHPAILPDWKGTAGYNVAILNKLKRWGATAHYVDEGIDTGKIIRIFSFDFDFRHETAQSLEKKTQEIQCDLYKSVIADVMCDHDFTAGLIDNNGGVYISRNDMEAMKKIDPAKDDISLKSRAFWFPPYSGAQIELNGKNYTIVDDFILSQLKADDQTSL
ncbi:MAG: hypothetical protein FWC09_10475 [Lachnospiraceae bacterium]|nr:hypothetical protein [Lachnospiraceae bacterium]